ncbi:adenosylcobinamide-GDP ribazoletransferase [Proteinivorax hydrogeniformans]|uniref:Adenosylcobinamide-GDP ribazoletransferase n=1 Tax=Proteinivorax hydrogeniformans TaxID=1826727 RepID=A0AAU8HVE6_9FIRM
MKNFLLMIQFFTRIPIAKEFVLEKEDFAKGICYFPLVGLIVGFINGCTYYVTSLVLEGIAPIVLTMLVNTLVTGALHLDGIADTCDAIFSARKKQKMLEIMKDSRIGTNGVLALFFILALKIAFLDLFSEDTIIAIIILSPVIGRTVMGVVVFRCKYARNKEGLGGLFIGKTTVLQTLLCLSLGTVACAALLGFIGIYTLIASILVGVMLRIYFCRILDGLTGDLLGAINEIVELAVLFVTLLLLAL